MPKKPFHGDPRHYEFDITKLKAEIERLEYRLAMANKEIAKHQQQRGFRVDL
jgi:hypothetical protein